MMKGTVDGEGNYIERELKDTVPTAFEVTQIQQKYPPIIQRVITLLQPGGTTLFYHLGTLIYVKHGST